MRERVAINQIDEIDRAIIDRLQGGFPVCEQPFAEAAIVLGIGEEELLSRLRRIARCARADSLRPDVSG